MTGGHGRWGTRGEARAGLLLALVGVVLLVALAAWLVGASGDGDGRAVSGDDAGGDPTMSIDASDLDPSEGVSPVGPDPSSALSAEPPFSRAWEDAPPRATGGVVRSVDGEPIAGAVVRPYPTSPDCAEAVTDDLGRWWFDPGSDLRGYGLEASHPAFAPEMLMIPSRGEREGSTGGPATEEGAFYEHVLRPRVTVTGTLRWSDGSLVSGTRLVLRPAAPMVPNLLMHVPLGEGETDDAGRFTLHVGARQVVRVEPEAPWADELPPDAFVRAVGDGPEEHWELVVPPIAELRVEVRADPEVHADVPESDLARLRVSLLRSLVPTIPPVVEQARDGVAAFDELDPRATFLVAVMVPGFEPAIVDWHLELEGAVTERAYDLPALEPRVRDPPPSEPEQGFAITWEMSMPDGSPLGRERFYALLPWEGGPYGRLEAVSLVDGGEGSVRLGDLGSESSGGRELLPVTPPARVTAVLGDHRQVFEGVDVGDHLVLHPPEGPDRHDVLLCPVDDHGRPFAVWALMLRHLDSDTSRIVPMLRSAHIPARLAAGRWRAVPRVLGGRAPVPVEFTVPPPDGGDRIEIPVPASGAVRVRLAPPPVGGSFDVCASGMLSSGVIEGSYGLPFFAPIGSDGTALLSALPVGRQELVVRRRDAAGVVAAVGWGAVEVVAAELAEVELAVEEPGGGRIVDLRATAYRSARSVQPGVLVDLEGPGGASRWAIVGVQPTRQHLAYGAWTARWTGSDADDPSSPPTPRSASFTVEPGDGSQIVDLDG